MLCMTLNFKKVSNTSPASVMHVAADISWEFIIVMFEIHVGVYIFS
jgi:hypothetical protein